MKPHRAGARFTLREDDLLHVDILPQSLNVHRVKMIVSKSGLLEFGEWITGSEARFNHHRIELNEQQLDVLTKYLTELGRVQRNIDLSALQGDLTKYEPQTRVFVKFWFEHAAIATFLPTHSFFADAGASKACENAFIASIEGVFACLPMELLSQ